MRPSGSGAWAKGVLGREYLLHALANESPIAGARRGFTD
jgi:hypothetical protein